MLWQVERKLNAEKDLIDKRRQRDRLDVRYDYEQIKRLKKEISKLKDKREEIPIQEQVRLCVIGFMKGVRDLIADRKSQGTWSESRSWTGMEKQFEQLSRQWKIFRGADNSTSSQASAMTLKVIQNNEQEAKKEIERVDKKWNEEMMNREREHKREMMEKRRKRSDGKEEEEK